jgi:hypothetical protein
MYPKNMVARKAQKANHRQSRCHENAVAAHRNICSEAFPEKQFVDLFFMNFLSGIIDS